MSILLCILLGFALGWMARKNSSKGASEETVRAVLRHRLESQADHEKNADVAAGIRQAAAYISEANVYDIPSQTPAEEDAQPTTPVTIPDRQVALMPPGSQAESPNFSVWPRTTSKPVDSISILLYFGAFLMISGVGLFVGLSDYSGGIKTLAVLVLALTFYGAGLVMHQTIERLRPAALALTAIGLICLPLTGAAAYIYLATMATGALIWFVTSLVSLCLYIVALYYIRQSLIGYLSVFMCLSLWLSISAVIDAPIYFFGWAMIVLGMLYLLTARRFRLWKEVEAPLSITASIMVPSSLGLTLLFGAGMIQPLQQGVTVLLAAAFYSIALWLEAKPDLRTTYFTLAYAFIPLGTLYIMSDITTQTAVTAFVLTAVTCLQLLAALLAAKTAAWCQSALVVTAIVLVASALLCTISANWWALVYLLGLQVIIYGIVAYWQRLVAYLGLGLSAALLIPAIVGFLASRPALPIDVISALYIALAVGMFALRDRLKQTSGGMLTAFAYVFALGIAWLIGLGGTEWVPMAASVSVGLLMIAAAYYERQAALLLFGTGLGIVAGLQWVEWQQVTWLDGVSWLVGSLGLIYYLLGKCEQRRGARDFANMWLASGIVAIYAAGLIAPLQGTPLWPSSLYLGIAGLITWYEARLRHRKTSQYFGGLMILFAVQLALYKLGLHEWQLYWYMWALYAVLIAYRLPMAGAICMSACFAAIGIFTGLNDHGGVSSEHLTLALMALSLAYFVIGKLHAVYNSQAWHEQAQAWTYTGLIGFYIAALFPAWFGHAGTITSFLPNSFALLIAGGLTSFEAYEQRSRNAVYIGAAVTLIGLQWLMIIQQIHEVQLYTHMWAVYFAALAWLAHRDKRLDEKQTFTVLALCIQTGPLALQALGGDTGYGLLLLFESIGLLLLGMWMRYSLLTWWGLSVAIASVLYQLRDFQFFVLVLLGAGIIGLGVYLLLRRERKN